MCDVLWPISHKHRHRIAIEKISEKASDFGKWTRFRLQYRKNILSNPRTRGQALNGFIKLSCLAVFRHGGERD